MTNARIARLGHVGLHVQDLEKQKAFYRDVIGLTVTDEDAERGLVFMSSRPAEEHHELLLCRGRNVGSDARVVQQISFRCETYWNTGLTAKQPYGEVLDLDQPAAQLLDHIKEHVAQYGSTGFIDPSRLGPRQG
jgi:catechol-2,3-dioxygenase